MSALLAFRRGGVVYAVDVAHVRRVVRAPDLRSIAAAPPFVAGGATVDGRFEVVVDPAALFGGAPEEEADASSARLVLLAAGGERWGLLADSVEDVSDLEASPAPPFVGGQRREGLAGVALRGEEHVLVLDPARLLSEGERRALSGTDSVRDGA